MSEQTTNLTTDAQAEIGENSPANILDAVTRVNREMDMNRIRATTSLINTFNYAIQVQAGRDMWNEDDTRSFFIAYQALDLIGSNAKTKQNLTEVEKDIAEFVGDGQSVRTNSNLQPNVVTEKVAIPQHPWPNRPDQTTRR